MQMSTAEDSRNPNFLRSMFEKGEFVCTAELVLGRDHNMAEAEDFVKEASAAQDGIKVISLTDLPGGNPALPPEAFALYVLEHKLTPIAHLTGKDGNRSFVEARLHGLARLGVENILALTGDAQKEGFRGQVEARLRSRFCADSVVASCTAEWSGVQPWPENGTYNAV